MYICSTLTLTSAVQPFVAVCVQGLGPQLVQVTISFAPVVPPVVAPPSRFFLPYDRVSVEETYSLNNMSFLYLKQRSTLSIPRFALFLAFSLRSLQISLSRPLFLDHLSTFFSHAPTVFDFSYSLLYTRSVQEVPELCLHNFLLMTYSVLALSREMLSLIDTCFSSLFL